MGYLRFSEVILVEDHRKLQPNDPPVYVREYGGERVLALDNNPGEHVDAGVKYGHIYYDSEERPCIVPDVWNEDDAMLAKIAITAS